MHVWGHIACVRGDTLHACVGPGVRMRGTRCVRGDPAGMRRVWGQHMKGAFGVQNIVSEDEVESMYYLPYKPSTGARTWNEGVHGRGVWTRAWVWA